MCHEGGASRCYAEPAQLRDASKIARKALQGKGLVALRPRGDP